MPKAITSVISVVATLALAGSLEAATASEVRDGPVQSCSLFASPTGNDANPGTQAAPVASPIKLLNLLGAGQTGCLKDGVVFELGAGAAITAAAGNPSEPKILRPTTPGARTTISARTGFWVQPAAHDLVFRDLDFRRPTATGSGSLFLLDGDRITLEGVDLSYASNICLDIGADPRAGATDSADDIVLRDSRIHDCGADYGPPHSQNDSGVHGIYAQFTRRLLIEDNYIYANHNRGLQLYPDADNSTIRHNVLHGNGANLNIGSQWNLGIASQGNVIENNILSDSVLDGLGPNGFVGDTSEVLGNLPAPGAGVPDFGNVVSENCIENSRWPTRLYEGYGYTHPNNIENRDPMFANPAAGNFSMPASSPCATKGPRAEGRPLSCAEVQSSSQGVTTPSPGIIQGTEGPDVIVGSEGGETIFGLRGDDLLCGRGGSDAIRGGLGADAVFGGGGSDSLMARGRSADADRGLDCGANRNDVARIDLEDPYPTRCEMVARK